MLRSGLCDFSDAYFVVKGTITVAGTSNKTLAFKYNVPFISCISKINITLIDNAEVAVMPMYNLIEYSKNCRKTTGNLWGYYRDELTHDTNDINISNKNVINSKSFNYKASPKKSTCSIEVKTNHAEGNEINNTACDANKSGEKVEIAVPLKYLSNVWRTLRMPLANCKLPLILTWSRECVITSMERRVIANARRDDSPTDATFQISDTKLYLPVVTLSTKTLISF